MRIFLANAPWKKPGFYGVRAGSRWPHFENDFACYMPFPFFLAYATAILKDSGYEVLLVDAIAEDLDEAEFFSRLEDFRPDVIVYEVSTASILVDLNVAARTREMFGGENKIVFAGAHKEMYESSFLQHECNVDYVLIGEYEFSLLRLMEHLKEKMDLREVEGLIFRNAEGEVVQNQPRPLEQDLDKFPWPARQFLPMHKYIDTPGGIPTPSLQLWASRGCPFKCIFCAWPQIMYGGAHYRTRRPKDVVDELEWCIQEYGFKSFYFDDDTFNIGKPRILALAHEIKERNIGLPWAIMARADTMDREMLEAMREAGLYALKYGVESGSQELVSKACKGLNLQKVRETIRITRELGIKCHLTFMFGLPGETWETVEETIHFAREMDPDTLQFSIATPFPGSQFYQMMREQGHLMSDDFNEYDGYHRAVIRTENLSARELEEALRRANKMWCRHQFFRDFKSRKWEYFVDGLTHPVRAMKKAREVFGI